MRFIPKSFMKIVEKGAVGVSNNNNSKGHAHFSCDKIDKKRINSEAKYSITNCFSDRTSVIFVANRHEKSIT